MENKMKVMKARKEQLFAYTTATFNLTKKLSTAQDLSAFLKRAQCVETNRTEFIQLGNDINLGELELNSSYKIDLNYLEAFHDMYGVIKYYEDKATKEKSQQQQSPPQQNSSNSTIKEFQVKLQPLEVDMPKSVKLQYLMSKLSGRALSVCAGVPPTETNYDVIYKALVDKYDDPRCIANHYLETLFSYKPMKLESGMQLSCFVDKFGSTVAALKALELDLGKVIDRRCTKDPAFQHVTCGECNKQFTRKSSLEEHIVKQHQASDSKSKTCMMPECQFKYLYKTLLIDHMKDVHKVPIQSKEDHVFSSWDEFNKWKEDFEGKTSSYYSKQYGDKKNKYSYYYCQQDGQAQQSTSTKIKSKKQPNIKGKIKTGNVCLSMMKVKKEGNSVHVQLYPSHS
ncbi:hypothetical protein WDU94_001814 [Cyamophila willieti]